MPGKELDPNIRSEIRNWIVQTVYKGGQISMSCLGDYGEITGTGRRAVRKLVTELIREGYLYKVEDTDRFGDPFNDVVLNPDQPYSEEK